MGRAPDATQLWHLHDRHGPAGRPDRLVRALVLLSCAVPGGDLPLLLRLRHPAPIAPHSTTRLVADFGLHLVDVLRALRFLPFRRLITRTSTLLSEVDHLRLSASASIRD